jgi:hypothetical protein
MAKPLIPAEEAILVLADRVPETFLANNFYDQGESEETMVTTSPEPLPFVVAENTLAAPDASLVVSSALALETAETIAEPEEPEEELPDILLFLPPDVLANEEILATMEQRWRLKASLSNKRVAYL